MMIKNLRFAANTRSWSTTLDKKRLYLEVYGCQMNVNDAELVHGILCKPEMPYEKTNDPESANVALLMTCSVREAAEDRAWARLDSLAALQKRNKHLQVIGVLGCMAERLKLKVFEKKPYINLVCGPDAYRNLPTLLDTACNGKQKAVDVDLSMHETYDEDLIDSIRNPLSKSAYISIMRGCNNMCTFCIVPFTRGRERSRSPKSIEHEIASLSEKGIKEITLLGQNVNSYNYIDETSSAASIEYSQGFTPLFKLKQHGLRFTKLLDDLSTKFPNIRFRFTSPHPRDFPDDLLDLIAGRKNISKHIHLPLQSGSSTVLERMRRGYTREAYLSLLSKIRTKIPGVAISTDVIAGFCQESDEEHQQTLDVFDQAAYDMAYMYAYSMREKTAAFRRYIDDVPEEVKQKRLADIIQIFKKRNSDRLDTYLGSETVVLIEGDSKRSMAHYCGRGDENNVVVLPKPEDPSSFQRNDFVKCKIVGRKGSTLIGAPIERVIQLS